MLKMLSSRGCDTANGISACRNPILVGEKEVEDTMFKSLVPFTQGIVDVKFSDEVRAYQSVFSVG